MNHSLTSFGKVFMTLSHGLQKVVYSIKRTLMKKLIFTFALLSGPAFLFAQGVGVGIKAGANFSITHQTITARLPLPNITLVPMLTLTSLKSGV